MTSADTPNEDAPQARRYTGLKIAIVLMGIGIIVMIGLLIAGVVLGWGKKTPETTGPSVPAPVVGEAPAAVPAGQPAMLDVETPKESRLYTLAGNGDRIALHIAAPTGDEIIVIDTAANKVISRIRLLPADGPTPSP